MNGLPEGFRPMLAATPTGKHPLQFPLMISPKLDGIRAIGGDGALFSRKLKLIPNAYIQNTIGHLCHGLDGELIVGKPTGNDVMNRTASGVMAKDGEPDFTYWVFDNFQDARASFRARYMDVCLRVIKLDHPRIKVLSHDMVTGVREFAARETAFVGLGYEGMMARHPLGAYKCGRSTEREGGLVKIKRFEDAEALVGDYIPYYENMAESKTDELGLMKKTKRKDDMKELPLLGALVCHRMVGTENIKFEIGSGFTMAQRAELWKDRALLPGRRAKFKFQGLTPDGVPRFPVFLGWRHEADLAAD